MREGGKEERGSFEMLNRPLTLSQLLTSQKQKYLEVYEMTPEKF